MALGEEDVPPLAPNPPEYNPPMPDEELRGGSAHSTGSSGHESEVERPNIKGLKDGPIAGHIGALGSAYRQQVEDPLQLTPEGLQELQSLHRNWTISQNNRLETQRVGRKEGSGSSNMSGGIQPTQPQSLTTAKGSRAWRKRII